MSPTLDNNHSIIAEHGMSQTVLTTVTWHILVPLFLPQAGIRTDQSWHAQLGPGRPPPSQIGSGWLLSAQTCLVRPLPPQLSPGRPACRWRLQLWYSSYPRRSWLILLQMWLRWQPCPLWPRYWPVMTLPIPLQG